MKGAGVIGELPPLAVLLGVVALGSGCGGREGPPELAAPKAIEGLEAVALTRGDSEAGGSRFERLAAERSGIDFVHRWTPPEAYRHELATSMSGSGVCIGDYDGDGLADVFLTRPFGGARLYRNLGGLRFADVTGEAGLHRDGVWGTGPSFADVDGDGDLDLYVSVYRGPNLLYLNRGDGTFEEGAAAAGLDYQGASVMMAFADYDLDGDLDGYLLTNRTTPAEIPEVSFIRLPGGGLDVEPRYRELFDVLERPDGPGRIRAGEYDYLYRNNGDGTFTDVSREAGIFGNRLGLSVTWWDYDGDGFPDLYVSNDFWGADQLLRNNGDGTFTDVARRSLPHTPWFSMGADAADINNDGLLDLMASDMSGTSHFKRKLGMGDMDENGWFLDFAEPRQYMRNAVYLNSGGERFMEVAYLAGLANTDWSWSVKLADLDDDGRVDVFVSNGMTRDWVNSDLVARAGQDVSGRTWLESPPRREANLAFHNRGDLRFESVGEAWGLDHVGISHGAALGDLDRDGDLDLVVNHFGEAAGVYRNQSAGGHRVVLRLQGRPPNTFGIGARVELESAAGLQIRELHLAHGFMSADEPLVHFGLGSAARIDRLTVRWPSGRRQSFEDLPADHLYTVLEDEDGEPRPSPGDPPPSLFRRLEEIEVAHRENDFDDFTRQPLLPHRLSRLGPGLAWGDVDDDGREELYVGGAAGEPGRLYRYDPAGHFVLLQAFDGEAESEDMAPLFFEADGDGDLDLYVVSGGYQFGDGEAVLQDRLYLNDGEGRFSRAPGPALPDLRFNGSVATTADFDRDGDLDLFVGGRVSGGRYPLAPKSHLLRNDGGRFADAGEVAAPGLAGGGLVTAAVWSDVDGDGWIDLLVTHEWGPVALYRNAAGRLVHRSPEAGLGDRTGWWNGIASGDLDNDGDVDFAVTNFGLNTKYHASPEKPALLYYGGLGRSQKPRLVEAEFEGEVLYPVRGRSCSTDAMPSLGEGFPTFESFASAALDEIYSLAEATEYRASSLESGVLINDGEGRFAFRPLPRLAQASPGFGVVFNDVDADGLLDLYLVQNFYSPQRETGRMDGGLSLLLLGQGDGGFDPVWPSRSGLIVPGDAKSLTVTDLNADGWADFVIGVNDAPLVAFESLGSPVHRLLNVRLRGRAGNPHAIGARVRVTAGGTTRTAEVVAGSGYLSQSTPALYFGLAEADRADRIEVRWPDGQTTDLEPPPRRTVVVRQPAG